MRVSGIVVAKVVQLMMLVLAVVGMVVVVVSEVTVHVSVIVEVMYGGGGSGYDSGRNGG